MAHLGRLAGRFASNSFPALVQPAASASRADAPRRVMNVRRDCMCCPFCVLVNACDVCAGQFALLRTGARAHFERITLSARECYDPDLHPAWCSAGVLMLLIRAVGETGGLARFKPVPTDRLFRAKLALTRTIRDRQGQSNRAVPLPHRLQAGLRQKRPERKPFIQ